MDINKEFVEKSETDNKKYNILAIIKIKILQEFFYTGLGTLGLFFFYSLFPSFFWNEPYRNIICAIIVFSFFILFIFLNQPNSKKKFLQVDYTRNIVLFTLFNLAIVIFLFFNTDFGYGGYSTDNFYRSAYVTQMAYSGYPHDFAIKGFSAFMAPLYWYILAVFARIFQIAPYKMLKVGVLASYYILPILLYEVYKKIFDTKTSFYIIAVFFTFIANYHELLFWIDHLISYVFFIPFFIYYFENYTNKDFTKKDFVLAGFLGSILICTFYLYFILVPIYVVIIIIQNKITVSNENFKHKIKRISVIASYMIVFSSWFWIPLLINIILFGFESHQNYFFPKYALDMPFEAYFELNLFSILLILGIIFIIMKYTISNLMKILGNIVISVYILYFLGYFGLLIGFPIVHYRVLVVSHYVLIIAFVLFYLNFFQILKNSKIANQITKKINIQTLETIILIIIIFFQNYRNVLEVNNSEYYQKSLTQRIPEEVDILSELDYENKVFLTQHYNVAAFLPIYLFVVYNAHFSHPSALNNERVLFLLELSECKSSKDFYKKIIENKFGPIDYFFLEPSDVNATKYLFDTAQLEYFPRSSDVKIYFEALLFENSDYFKKHEIKGEIIYQTIY